MALFGNKKTKSSKKGESAAPQESSIRAKVGRDLSHVLRQPRITEKATMHQSESIYTFDIDDRATKSEVVKAVLAQYGVTPAKVRVVSIPVKQKRSFRTGTRGATRGGKKAYVYLKKGETITIT
jgi:ribosomal protein L23